MNQEIKDKLKQAAEKAWEQDQQTNPTPVNPHAYVYGFKAGAKTILENPQEWGLIDAEIHSNAVKRNYARTKEIKQLQSQLTKYREALERLYRESKHNIHVSGYVGSIAKEALKQQ